MDKNRSLGSKAFLRFLCIAVATAATASLARAQAPSPAWTQAFQMELSRLEVAYPGQLGVYVKDLGTGLEAGHRADESWYLASGVKIPIALETLRQVDQGKIRLQSTIELRSEDRIDGAGSTNRRKDGELLSVRYLLEQMLIYSDNTASDLLLRQVGLARVNGLVSTLVPEGFSEITTLADVRRHVYGGFHPAAFQLKNQAFLKLRKVSDEGARIQALAELLSLTPGDLSYQDLDRAYDAYYSSKLNSAPLRSYARLLEKVLAGGVLQPESLRFLLRTLARVKTGKSRLKAGLPRTVTFAHKTGTQHSRICDFGVIWDHPGELEKNSKRLVVTSCVRDFHSLPQAEKALRSVGLALSRSGYFGASR